MSVRLFHQGSRLVVRSRRSDAGRETWWAIGRPPPEDWRQVLERPLLLLDLDPLTNGVCSLSCKLGTVAWTTGWRWATIDVHLDQGSAARRALVTAALLKAARYGRIKSD